MAQTLFFMHGSHAVSTPRQATSATCQPTPTRDRGHGFCSPSLRTRSAFMATPALLLTWLKSASASHAKSHLFILVFPLARDTSCSRRPQPSAQNMHAYSPYSPRLPSLSLADNMSMQMPRRSSSPLATRKTQHARTSSVSTLTPSYSLSFARSMDVSATVSYMVSRQGHISFTKPVPSSQPARLASSLVRYPHATAVCYAITLLSR